MDSMVDYVNDAEFISVICLQCTFDQGHHSLSGSGKHDNATYENGDKSQVKQTLFHL